MPQIFRVGAYLIYFWSGEGDPTEPVHVHVSKGVPSESSTKIWITKNGRCLLCHNKSQIPRHQLKIIMGIIEARNEEVTDKWLDYFGSIYYYC